MCILLLGAHRRDLCCPAKDQRVRREMKQAIIELTAAVRELAAAIKEGKEENSPTPPIRRNPKKQTKTTTTRARARFVKKLLNLFAT